MAISLPKPAKLAVLAVIFGSIALSAATAQAWRWRRQPVRRLAPYKPVLSFQGTVVAVLDGDTVSVLDTNQVQHRIRLMGIDAPEKAQAFGQVSKRNLSNLVYGKVVEVQYREDDRYGRTVGKLLVYGVDANLEQIRAGLAWHYAHFAKDQIGSDAQTYATAENEARTAHRGLWIDPNPEAPWDYRHGRE